MADTGNSATLVLSGGFTANYYEIGGTEQEVPKIKDSHLGSVDKETYIFGDLYEPGEMEVEYDANPGSPPALKTVQTATLTYPVPTGLTNGATLAGTGAVIKRTSPMLKNNELMTGKFTWAWDGKTGPTYTPAS